MSPASRFQGGGDFLVTSLPQTLSDAAADYYVTKQKVKVIGDPVGFLLEGRAAFQAMPQKEDLLIGDANLIVNPCPNHPPVKGKPDLREANWLCLDDHVAICDECMPKHQKKYKKHTVLDLRTCINEARSVLCNLETEAKALIKDTETQVARGKSLIQLIEARKERYKKKQEFKLERAIEQLKLILEKNIQDYDEAITGRFSQMVSTTHRTEKQIKDKLEFLKEIQVLKKIFELRQISNVSDKVTEVGERLIQFRIMKSEEPDIVSKYNHFQEEIIQIGAIDFEQDISTLFDAKIRELKEQQLQASISKMDTRKRQQRMLQARKLKIVRWRQKKISVYDLDQKNWQTVEVRSDKYFLPFSRTVYLPNSLDFLNFGGLDDTEVEKPFFTNTGASYTLFAITDADLVVIPKPIKSMVKARGCFGTCYLYEFVYAVGGVNIIEGVLTGCERYDLARGVWQEISDLNVPRKNASLCALTADSMYVFGGTTQEDRMTDVIEQYLVSANIWVTLPVRMQYKMSFLSTFKVSPFQILILGGIVEGESDIVKESFVTNQVSLYDIRHPEVKLLDETLAEDFVAINAPFFNENGSIVLVSEDDTQEFPRTCSFDINCFLAHPKNTLAGEDA